MTRSSTNNMKTDRYSGPYQFELGKIPKIDEPTAATWRGTDTYENYLSRGNRSISAESVSYILNSLGYRCPELDSSIKKQTVFIGCSLTYGEGLPYESVWAYIVWNNIRSVDETQTEYINLSNCGASWEYIYRIMLQAIPVIEPKNLFIYFPHMTRFEYLNTNSEDLRFMQWVPSMANYENSILNQGFSRLATEERYIFHKSILLLRGIELICQQFGVNLFWSSWDKDILRLLRRFKPQYGTYIDCPFPNITTASAARDGVHPGIQHNQAFADTFFSAYQNPTDNRAVMASEIDDSGSEQPEVRQVVGYQNPKKHIIGKTKG